MYLPNMKAISATKLRQNLYIILDSVVDSGIPVEIERKGRILKIIPEKRSSKWDRLEKQRDLRVPPRHDLDRYLHQIVYVGRQEIDRFNMDSRSVRQTYYITRRGR